MMAPAPASRSYWASGDTFVIDVRAHFLTTDQPYDAGRPGPRADADGAVRRLAGRVHRVLRRAVHAPPRHRRGRPARRLPVRDGRASGAHRRASTSDLALAARVPPGASGWAPGGRGAVHRPQLDAPAARGAHRARAAGRGQLTRAGSGHGGDDVVAREDADQPAILVDDGNPVHLAGVHALSGLDHPVGCANGHGSAAHDVLDQPAGAIQVALVAEPGAGGRHRAAAVSGLRVQDVAERDDADDPLIPRRPALPRSPARSSFRAASPSGSSGPMASTVAVMALATVPRVTQSSRVVSIIASCLASESLRVGAGGAIRRSAFGLRDVRPRGAVSHRRSMEAEVRTMRVKDLMTTPVVCVSVETPLEAGGVDPGRSRDQRRAGRRGGRAPGGDRVRGGPGAPRGDRRAHRRSAAGRAVRAAGFRLAPAR